MINHFHTKYQTDLQDTGYTLFEQESSIERSDAGVKVTGRLPAGSSYMIQESESETSGLSTSASAGANFFDLLEASVSVTVEKDYTVQLSTGITVNVDCEPGQYGIVY